MASLSSLSFLCNKSFRSNPISIINSSFSLSSQLALRRHSLLPPPAAKSWSQARGDADPSYSAESLRKPVVLPVIESPSACEESSGEDDEKKTKANGEDENGWVDWEDQILEDTVPLSGFVRMILHSGRYNVGDRLSPHHETTILDKLLPYHPEYEEKIGIGVDYIKVDYHPNFEASRCLFIVQEDGKLVDFSYWKCIKGLIRKKYPLFAESFILRHFPRPQRSD